jgi:class 3 adenylate cyclase
VSTGEDLLKTHRAEVTVVFVDLRGFTAFSEMSEPEEVMAAGAVYLFCSPDSDFVGGQTLHVTGGA